MGLDRFELLQLRRDDGIWTFHGREISTARPVQVHLFTTGLTPENVSLLASLDRLPPLERSRVIEKGQSEGKPYVVTDRLAGFESFREWARLKAPAKTTLVNPAAYRDLDAQFHQLFAEEGEESSKGNPFLWMAFGVLAAFVVLGLIVAVFVFRPR